MNRSVVSTIADKASQRPEWVERDGDRDVLVRGFSPLDNLVFGALAAVLILAPVVIFIVSHL